MLNGLIVVELYQLFMFFYLPITKYAKDSIIYITKKEWYK